MQIVDNYGLLGVGRTAARRAAAAPADTTIDATVEASVDKFWKDLADRAMSPTRRVQRDRPAPTRVAPTRAPRPRMEARPGGPPVLVRTGSRGGRGGLASALRALSTPTPELFAQVRDDPEMALRTLARLDRLISQVGEGRPC